MLVSLCYVLLRWLLEFVALKGRSSELKDLEIIVLRHEPHDSSQEGAATGDHRRRPGIPRREPSVATRAVAILHRHAGDAAALASTPGRQAVDLRSLHRASADAT